MDRLRQKTRKDKPKYGDKEKPPLFITDVKTIKENLKIKEILRTVKMNSSMRVKAPRGSKIMQNKDFNDNDDFEDLSSEVTQEPVQSSAMNSVLTSNSDIVEATNNNCVNNNEGAPIIRSNSEGTIVVKNDKQNKSYPVKKEYSDQSNGSTINGKSDNDDNVTPVTKVPEIKTTLVDDCPRILPRERKLSLDQTMWTRRQSLSQSEIDLHSIGKSPLERKSSFFRKKMDSFLKNTTEIFKKQSVSRSQSELGRKGSMSVSLQSLDDKFGADNTSSENINRGSATSLQSSAAAQSTSSLAASQGERLSPGPGDHESITSGDATTEEMLSGSVNSLSDAYLSQGLLNSRAISMSSGLDTVKRRKRKTSWANRVTWLASETMTNYLKRVIPDDYNKDMSTCHSYQDLSSIPEVFAGETDSKGRRLSYQRAVSGEDPVLPTRYSETTLRRKHGIPEDFEADCELSNLLAHYTEHGVPTLKGYDVAPIPENALAYLQLAEKPERLRELIQKKMTPAEEARQTVIRELFHTEADYLKHLMAIVEVFIATAHALQKAGKLLDVDTEKLFSNIPDVLNASLHFWETTFLPVLKDSAKNRTPFDTEIMSPGFCRFREVFAPYEKYVGDQSKALDYLRSLSSNTEFMVYLTWCHGHKSCKRLQLSDILVKPMQRLTKYSLILRRIIAHTEFEPERTTLMAMESFSKNYVLDINRAIRQKEELERLEALANSLDPYEVEFKDEDIDKYFKMYSAPHLRAPMIGCLPSHSRSVIFQGDLRYKDNINTKEIEVHIVLLTDMILVCKKQSKGNPLKIIRPKYMIDKILHFPRLNRNKEIDRLVFIVVDDVGTATFGFSISESNITSKTDPPTPPPSLKMWEMKVREARLSYDLGVWFAKNPSRDLSEVEMDSSSEYAISAASGPKPSSDDINIEREARERVAAMLHRSMGASTEYDFSQASLTTDSFDGTSGPRTSGAPSLRHPMHRNSTGGSSRNSRLSSFQQSTSAASRDEPGQPPAIKATGSVDNAAALNNQEDINNQLPPKVVTNITVNVLSESESETIVPAQEITATSSSKLNPKGHGSAHTPHSPGHGSGYGLGTGPAHSPSHSPAHSLGHSSGHSPGHGGLTPGHSSGHGGLSPGHGGLTPGHSPSHGALSAGHSPSHSTGHGGLSAAHGPGYGGLSAGHSPSHIAGPSSSNTLRVQPQPSMALVHSLPDLTIEPTTSRPLLPGPMPVQAASDKLYQSHQELLQRNRLATQHQYLTPDHRGTSYPPPSPTRGSLKRGLAFSYSFKNPPLSKMGHVNSQTQLQAEAGPSTSQSPARSERSPSPMPGPSTSTDKGEKSDKSDKPEKSEKEKKSKHFASRNKSGGSVSPGRKDDKGD